MKIEIKDSNNKVIPKMGELWMITPDGSMKPYLAIAVNMDKGVNFVSLYNGNRWADSMSSFEELCKFATSIGYTMSKFTGTATISN